MTGNKYDGLTREQVADLRKMLAWKKEQKRSGLAARIAKLNHTAKEVR